MIRCCLLTAAGIILFSCSSSRQEEYMLLWSDEFNYTGLPDTSKWGYDVDGHGWATMNCCIIPMQLQIIQL
jgi:hypothetical protein